MHQSWAEGDVILDQGESNRKLPLTAPKRNLFQRPKIARYSLPNLPVQTEKTLCPKNFLYLPTLCNAMYKKGIPAMEIESSMLEQRNVLHISHQINNKNDTSVPGSSSKGLEYKSFFAAECERIYNQLKLNDIKQMNVGDFCTIETELPPALSTMHSILSVLDPENTQIIEKSALRVSQLDLEKMNFNCSIPESITPSQAAPEDVLCSTNRTAHVEKETIANTTQDIAIIHGERSVQDAFQETVNLNSEQSTADTTHDIETTHDKRPVADSLDDVVAVCNTAGYSEKPAVLTTQECRLVCSDMSVADATHDIILDVEPTTQPTGKSVLMHNIANSTLIISTDTNPRAIGESQLYLQANDPCNAENDLNQTCSGPVLSCNKLVTVGTCLEDITYMHQRGDSENYTQDVLSTVTEVLKYHSKPFTYGEIKAHNITQDIQIKDHKVTATNTFCNVTTTIRYHDMTTDGHGENNQTIEPDKKDSQVWPVEHVDLSSPIKGHNFYSRDSMCDLNLTDFSNSQNVLCTPSLITSTPLPGSNNAVFVKKMTGYTVQQKPRLLLNKIPKLEKNVSTQHKRLVPPLPFPVQSSIGDNHIKKRISKGLIPGSHPKPSEQSTFQPECGSGISVPCTMQGFNSVFKTPLMAVTSTKVHSGPAKTNIPTVARNISRKKIDDVPQWSCAPVGSLQQQVSGSCLKTDKNLISKDGQVVSKIPMVSFMRPSSQLCTPKTGISRQKAKNIAGAQSAVCNCRVSSLHAVPIAEEFLAPGLVRPDQTFVFSNQAADSEKISSKTKSRLPGLPIRRQQGTRVKHSNREHN